jgi:hypothetical protein
MKSTDLKKYLNTRSREQLIAEIGEMFSRLDVVKDYYQGKLNLGYSEEVSQKYKSIIKHEFFPARGYGRAQLSVARKAVSDYKKVSASKLGIADIMIYYVEMGVEYTNEYGDIDGAFYDSMVGMFEKAVEFIVKHELKGQFEERCSEIVADGSGIGWGFSDQLNDIYFENFEDESDEGEA